MTPAGEHVSPPPPPDPTKQAFSLVELSIVLVILGLLTGGILAGQSLVRAAELRSVSTEYARYTAAAYAFRDKYFALPGDMTNATAFWGKDNTNCAGNTGAAATPGTCNGDGNGQVNQPGADGVTGEMYQFWKQLALAGLIEGTYTGIGDATSACSLGQGVILGTNSPKSKLPNSGWAMVYFGHVGDSWTYTIPYNNMFVFGGQAAGCIPVGGTLKPEEAWNIDTKIDDGKPGSGKLMAHSSAGAWGSQDACTTSSSSTDYTGDYRLNNTALVCSFMTKDTL